MPFDFANLCLRFKYRNTLEVLFMTEKQFNSEMEYQIRRTIINKMLKEEILTEQEYEKIDTKLLEEYEPTFGSLYR